MVTGVFSLLHPGTCFHYLSHTGFIQHSHFSAFYTRRFSSRFALILSWYKIWEISSRCPHSRLFRMVCPHRFRARNLADFDEISPKPPFSLCVLPLVVEKMHLYRQHLGEMSTKAWHPLGCGGNASISARSWRDADEILGQNLARDQADLDEISPKPLFSFVCCVYPLWLWRKQY